MKREGDKVLDEEDIDWLMEYLEEIIKWTWVGSSFTVTSGSDPLLPLTIKELYEKRDISPVIL